MVALDLRRGGRVRLPGREVRVVIAKLRELRQLLDGFAPEFRLIANMTQAEIALAIDHAIACETAAVQMARDVAKEQAVALFLSSVIEEMKPEMQRLKDAEQRHLKLIADLSRSERQDEAYRECVQHRATLIAEVGTLKAKVHDLEAELEFARAAREMVDAQLADENTALRVSLNEACVHLGHAVSMFPGLGDVVARLSAALEKS